MVVALDFPSVLPRRSHPRQIRHGSRDLIIYPVSASSSSTAVQLAVSNRSRRFSVPTQHSFYGVVVVHTTSGPKIGSRIFFFFFLVGGSKISITSSFLLCVLANKKLVFIFFYFFGYGTVEKKKSVFNIFLKRRSRYSRNFTTVFCWTDVHFIVFV